MSRGAPVTARSSLRFDFGTGEAAKVLGVHQQTIIRWCREGRIPFHLVPMSRYRRITIEDLIEFAMSNGMQDFVPGIERYARMNLASAHWANRR